MILDCVWPSIAFKSKDFIKIIEIQEVNKLLNNINDTVSHANLDYLMAHKNAIKTNSVLH